MSAFPFASVCDTCNHCICTTCDLHMESSFGGPFFCERQNIIDGKKEFCPGHERKTRTTDEEIIAIHRSIIRIEEKVDRLILIERTLRKEKSVQREDEMNQKLQLRTQRLEKDNLALRTMLAKALELLSGDDE